MHHEALIRIADAMMVVVDLDSRGIAVSRKDGRLLVSDEHARLTPELKERLEQHKKWIWYALRALDAASRWTTRFNVSYLKRVYHDTPVFQAEHDNQP